MNELPILSPTGDFTEVGDNNKETIPEPVVLKVTVPKSHCEYCEKPNQIGLPVT